MCFCLKLKPNKVLSLHAFLIIIFHYFSVSISGKTTENFRIFSWKIPAFFAFLPGPLMLYPGKKPDFCRVWYKIFPGKCPIWPAEESAFLYGRNFPGKRSGSYPEKKLFSRIFFSFFLGMFFSSVWLNRFIYAV